MAVARREAAAPTGASAESIRIRRPQRVTFNLRLAVLVHLVATQDVASRALLAVRLSAVSERRLVLDSLWRYGVPFDVGVMRRAGRFSRRAHITTAGRAT